MAFDPDQYIARKTTSGGFNPDAYIASKQPATQPLPNQSTETDWSGGAMTALQGIGLNFMDEAAAAVATPIVKLTNMYGMGGHDMGEIYRTIRDQYRGDVKKFAAENPKAAIALSVAGSAPTAMVAGPAAAVRGAATVAPKIGVIPKTVQAMKLGGAFGGVSGLGGSESETLAGMASDAAKGAAIGGVLSGVSQPIMSAIGAASRNVAQRFGGASADAAAKLKLTEAMQRDARGSADPFLQAQARMQKLGPDATIAESAGASTRGLLDTLATLPGKTKNQVETLIRQRQAMRAGKMTAAADKALGTQGMKAGELIDDLIKSRSKIAGPLYEKVREAPVVIDDEIAGLLQSTSPFHKEAERLAMMKGTPLNLEGVQIGDQVPLKHLDMLKQTLYDVAEAAKRSGQNNVASEANRLRVTLTNKLDQASPKNYQGESIYKQARDVFAGHSEMKDAVEYGKKAMFESADNIADMTAGMSQSQLEAFRVGAINSIRQKLGSEAGQTQMMKMWKEPNTSERLKQIFGNDYRKFAADVAKEARLKGIESVGRGSQTASRQYAAGDLDAIPVGELGSLAANAKAGNLFAAASSLNNVWNRVQMPEATRNKLSDLMLMQGAQGQQEIYSLSQFLRSLEGQQQSRAGSIGAEFGYQSGK